MNIDHVLNLAQKEKLRTEMELFLAKLLGCTRLDLIAHREKEIPVQHLQELQKAWVKIQAGYPVAYLTQEKEFYGLTFYVDERVLVPRPETEQMVDLCLKYVKGSVLELGTGSGAIACSIKKSRPDLLVTAGDISQEALDVASKNCVQLGVKIQLLQSDLLEKIPLDDFDVLLANLPYIGTQKHNFIADNVARFEPQLALDGGSDGLQLYKRLFEQILEQKRNFHFIFGEIGFSQGPDIEKLCQTLLPNYQFTLLQDFQGLDRHFVLERSKV